MISLKKMFYSNSLSIEDLAYLSKLLDTNLSLNHCLMLLENKHNKNIFNSIRDSLNKGKLIEEVIGDYLPSSIKTYLIPLLKKLSFSSGRIYTFVSFPFI